MRISCLVWFSSDLYFSCASSSGKTISANENAASSLNEKSKDESCQVPI